MRTTRRGIGLHARATIARAIARTAAGDNDDVSDNRDHYYLRDAMGGHMGVIVDDERADPCG